MSRFVRNERLWSLAGIASILVITFWVVIQGAGVSDVSQYKRKPGWANNDNFNYKVAKQKETASWNKEKAAFVTLARNSDLYSLLPSILSVEDRFNHRFHYDWVFLNDEPFSDEFKRVTSAMVSGKTKYGIIPKEQWSFPDWIDQDAAAKTREQMEKDKVIYGGSISYRHMCRYESGFFYRHEEMMEYEWYWRVEPHIKLYCDIDYDVFKFMKDNNKKYGFTISIHEYPFTIKTLWSSTKEFIEANPQYVHKNNMLPFISDDNGKNYNLCHFWSNFEIGSLDFWRGEAYSKYFDFLDKKGGFFYERWGDAPIHSIAAALFLDRDEIHHFDDIGYLHPPFTQCPIEEKFRTEHNCACNPDDDFSWKAFSCNVKYYLEKDLKKPTGWAEHTG
ncbi:alpha-1,2-mannosyltransferase KTR1 Ecym_5352 [Eremothecium cymbalariae DBVPG|uniref:Glycosyltransferase family 15 protein n=1 Tax=Eremothecium cymbalariae (strain CBS 270.75 / DBVPG 7215 / KCTC 17166 / NRRL Y-17582) TaxID=931890 RepID=I6NDG9_ERECY|nr:hypothetical protein Ecym_5352 [Eremothecium cymbalariae DBVPG\